MKREDVENAVIHGDWSSIEYNCFPPPKSEKKSCCLFTIIADHSNRVSNNPNNEPFPTVPFDHSFHSNGQLLTYRDTVQMLDFLTSIDLHCKPLNLNHP